MQQALYEMQGAIDAGMGRSLQRSGNTADNLALQRARGQYRNILVLERALGYAGEQNAAGIISPQNLARATRALHGMRNYVRGQGTFADLARSGSEVMGNLPNSMTAARNRVGALPGMIGGALGASLMGAGHGIDPMMGLGAAAGAGAAHYGTGAALMSAPGRAWLGNNILQPDHNPFASAALRGLYTKNSPWSPQ